MGPDAGPACPAGQPLELGQLAMAATDAALEVGSTCQPGPQAGVAFELELAEAAHVQLYMTPGTAGADLALSIRTGCAAQDEVACIPAPTVVQEAA